MKIGVCMTLEDRHGDVGAIAQRAEELGFESIWLPDHPVIPIHHDTSAPGAPPRTIPEAALSQVNPFVALARASGTTTTIKLATGVCLAPEHNPIDLAKQISTLDMYSGGRFIFGIGTGWFREATEVMGGDYDHRWTQAKEYVLAMKELWSNDEAEFHGRYVDFPPVRCNPRPAQEPYPPVHLGGTAPNVHKRVVAWGEGWMPSVYTPDRLDMLKAGRATLDELATAAGRDPVAIEVSAFGPPPELEFLKQIEEAGADRAMVRVRATDHAGILDQLDRAAGAVLR